MITKSENWEDKRNKPPKTESYIMLDDDWFDPWGFVLAAIVGLLLTVALSLWGC